MNYKHRITLGVSLALTLFFILPWLSLAQQAEQLREFIPQESARGRLLYLTISVFLTSLIFFQYNFFWRRKFIGEDKPKWVIISSNLLINFLLVFIVSAILYRVSWRIFSLDTDQLFFSIFFFRNTGIASVAGLVVYSHDKAAKSKRDEIKLLSVSREKAENELAALKSQLDPHFLFNTLNSLIAVIRQDAKEGIKFVNHLSETFRYTLEKKDVNLVSVEEELNFLDSYSFMMKSRFGKGLQIDVSITDRNRQIPQFALQTLVENAIKHNIASEKRPLTVAIKQENDSLLISNNVQLKATSSQGFGIGLTNLNKRYELLGNRSVDIDKGETIFTVTIPLLGITSKPLL